MFSGTIVEPYCFHFGPEAWGDYQALYRVGQNHAPFVEIAARVGVMVDSDLSSALEKLLSSPTSVLDLTEHQRWALTWIGIKTVREALTSTEATFQKAMYIGPVRSQKMMNVVTAAVMEFLSG